MDELNLESKLRQWGAIAEALINNKLPLTYKIITESKDSEGNNIINVEFYDRIEVMKLIKSSKLKPIVSQSFDRSKYKEYEDTFINPCGFTEEWYIEDDHPVKHDEPADEKPIEKNAKKKWVKYYDDLNNDYSDVFEEIVKKMQTLPMEHITGIIMSAFYRWEDWVDINLYRENKNSYIVNEWNKITKKLEEARQKRSENQED